MGYTVSIMQPCYLPWLAYYDRIFRSDMHIVLDHVQFEKGSVSNRNRLRNKQQEFWLTVPVKTKGQFGNLPLNEIEIDNTTDWRYKHWRSVELNYQKAPCFDKYAGFFAGLYRDRSWHRLGELNQYVTDFFLETFGITTPLHYSSDLPYMEWRKSELVLELCKAVSATTYLSGPAGRDYLQLGAFEAAGIEVRFHEYPAHVYHQCWEFGNFIPGLSAVDALLNCGENYCKEHLLHV